MDATKRNAIETGENDLFTYAEYTRKRTSFEEFRTKNGSVTC